GPSGQEDLGGSEPSRKIHARAVGMALEPLGDGPRARHRDALVPGARTWPVDGPLRGFDAGAERNGRDRAVRADHGRRGDDLTLRPLEPMPEVGLDLDLTGGGARR